MPYVDQEHDVWRQINTLLEPIHARRACSLYLRMKDVAGLDRIRVPQLSHINSLLERSTGFSLVPIDGLVEPRRFLAALASGRMLCTQYIRHHTVPLYTPEPDIVHEIIGHAVMFFDPEYCRLNAEIGEAARVLSDESLIKLERLYWYSVEFGLLNERGVTRAFGAGLLSSAGELDSIDSVENAPFRWEDIVQVTYNTMHMQRVLFKSDGIDEMYRGIRSCIQCLRRIENV